MSYLYACVFCFVFCRYPHRCLHRQHRRAQSHTIQPIVDTHTHDARAEGGSPYKLWTHYTFSAMTLFQRGPLNILPLYTRFLSLSLPFDAHSIRKLFHQYCNIFIIAVNVCTWNWMCKIANRFLFIARQFRWNHWTIFTHTHCIFAMIPTKQPEAKRTKIEKLFRFFFSFFRLKTFSIHAF